MKTMTISLPALGLLITCFTQHPLHTAAAQQDPLCFRSRGSLPIATSQPGQSQGRNTQMYPGLEDDSSTDGSCPSAPPSAQFQHFLPGTYPPQTPPPHYYGAGQPYLPQGYGQPVPYGSSPQGSFFYPPYQQQGQSWSYPPQAGPVAQFPEPRQERLKSENPRDLVPFLGVLSISLDTVPGELLEIIGVFRDARKNYAGCVAAYLEAARRADEALVSQVSSAIEQWTKDNIQVEESVGEKKCDSPKERRKSIGGKLLQATDTLMHSAHELAQRDLEKQLRGKQKDKRPFEKLCTAAGAHYALMQKSTEDTLRALTDQKIE